MTTQTKAADNRMQQRKDRVQQQRIAALDNLNKLWAVLTSPGFDGHVNLRIDGKNGLPGAIRATIENYIPPPQ